MDKIDRDNMFIDRLDKAFLTIERGKIYRVVIENAERPLIEKALEHSYGNQVLAASILGLNRNTLRTKIRKLRIDVLQFKE